VQSNDDAVNPGSTGIPVVVLPKAGSMRRTMLEAFGLRVRSCLSNDKVPLIILSTEAGVASTDETRIVSGLRHMTDKIIESLDVDTDDARRSIAWFGNHTMWDICIYQNTVDDASRRHMMQRIWRYAPDRIDARLVSVRPEQTMLSAV
jgi:hypothetical protein